MKIAIIGSRGYPYVYSGYETFVKELVERLVKQNIEVVVYCHKNLFKAYPAEVNGVKLKYFSTIQSKSLSQLVHSFQTMLHACFQDYDVVLVVNSANGPFGLFTKIFRKKTAINVDGLEWLRPKWKGLGAKYFYLASKLSTKLYDQVITDSFEMQKIYRDEFKSDSVVIAYGANIRYSKEPKLISKWNLKPLDYYLIVGRLIPDNNADLLVEEFVRSKSEKKLVIVGDVPYKDAYAEKIKSVKDPRVIFTGYIVDQNELAELYHNCFIYFHGHQYGGTNPTMLKALAYGCAILALDTVFNREMLDGDNYGMFFTKQPGFLARIIEEVENNETHLNVLRNKARERIINNYTWEKIASQYIDLFRNLSKKQVNGEA
jgi:glycosyltransferase involved in cell wall biosynthesis